MPRPSPAAVATLVLLLGLAAHPSGQEPAPRRHPDVIYVASPQEVVDAMLQLAAVTSADVVYDLGSGDGRIPITAAQKFGARGVGIDIDPVRIREANVNRARAGVGNRVRFLNQDLFETDLRPATVITLYLLTSMNQKLVPTLKKLKPGTRIVAHSYALGPDWPPDRIEQVSGKTIFLWVVK